MVTVVPRRVVVDAVMAERRRCAKVLEGAIKGARGSGLEPLVRDVLVGVLADRLERIRQPWRVRQAIRRAAVPGRLRKSCGLCGGDDHRAPKCLGRAA